MTTTVTTTTTIIITPPPETTGGTVTSWLPLATTWPAPDSSCWNRAFVLNNNTAVDTEPLAFWPHIAIDYNTGPPVFCQPRQVYYWYESLNSTASEGELAIVTSIQPLVCPDMWYTALTTFVRNSVQVTCCPSGYTANPLDDHGVQANCASTLSARQTFQYLYNGSGITTSFPVAVDVAAVAVKGWNSIAEIPATLTTSPTYPSSSSPTSTISSSSSSSSTTTTTTTTTTATTTSATSSSTGDTSISGSSGTLYSSSLHGGAVAGVFVGVFAAVALIAAGIASFVRRRRQQRKQQQQIPDIDDTTSGKNILSYPLNSRQDGYSNVPQSPEDRLSELPTISNTPEMFVEYDPHSPRGDHGDVHEMQ
ncbi:conserved hypothetical protein [Talaromyces stipitatus ATCC 10500]|uniref:Uncharacterized protein n=1 Tax=Talaromyces stipitatus (strain ATCC 10500 / CBS 375.48 / QM 6759 / NRRL 1006) TaxID=441959 RepID=B8M0K5_TALSN|nr:uncharacterized protein TSTA_085330 [Talaromyces stipitatus ATCC 10500]EED21302.1 conserved hypothetical protein [Talaromyces stipitatus ATCC 10500]